jgi:pimeloyl-ACP methyl ester carboxylesterase
VRTAVLAIALVLAIAAGPALAAPIPDRDVGLGEGATALRGSLKLAANPGPAVLIIAGSGPTDRDGNSSSPGVKPANLRQIAEALAEHGYSSLRADKRGIAKSAGAMRAEADLRFTDYVDDAVAWTRFLKSQPGVTCVVILGHSEGALIASMAAQRTPVCGVISISGAGRAFGVVLREQIAATGAAPQVIKDVDAVLTRLEHGQTVPDIPATNALLRPSVQPYLISELNLDPPAEIKAVKAPVLILQGDHDIQVSVDDARRLAAARPDARLVILPGVNHVLKAAPADRAGNIATYADSNLPLASGVAEAIVAFVSKAKP